jgi:arginine decarboxylase
MIPKYFFITKGQGRHKDQLQSFEMALRNAGIHICNLVSVSSILPPGCKKVSPKKGRELLKPGQVTYVVMSKNSTNEPNRLIAASVGIAIPSDAETYGYISEHHSFGQTDEVAGDYAEDLAATMLATTRGIEFDPNTAWDERKQIYRSSGLIIKTTDVTQSAQGDKNGRWTTVLAAVVFIM